MSKRPAPRSAWHLLGSSLWRSFSPDREKTKKTLIPQEILGYEPDPIQLGWADWAFDGKSSRKLFLGARGYGKTDLIVLYGIIRHLYENPQKTFLVMCRNIDTARNIVKLIADALQNLGIPLQKTQNSFSILGISRPNPKQPSVSALSVSGRTKGHHADYLFLDDPLDPLDIYMSRIQRRVRKVYDEAFNIAKNILVIGQYIGPTDLYTQIEQKVDTLRAWHGTIPHLDIDKEQFLKTGSLKEWGYNYGGFVLKDADAPFADLQIVKDTPTGSVFAYLDVALGKGDYTALSIGWRSSHRVVVAGFLYKESYTRALPQILAKLEEYSVTRAYYENNGIGDALYLASNGVFREEHSSEPKVRRISRLEAPLWHGKIVFHPDSMESYIQQIRDYQPYNSEHDDAPDSLAGLYKILELFPNRGRDSESSFLPGFRFF